VATIRGSRNVTWTWRRGGGRAHRSRGVVAVAALLIGAPLVVSPAAASAFDAGTAGQSAAASAIDPGTAGQWSGVLPWVDRAVNAHVLPTGKVMYWPAWFGDAPARIWDPATGATVNAPFAGYNIFCTGEVFLADGRMFLAGGSVDNVNPFGTKNTSMYDPFANTWTTLPEMAQPRWYPTTTLLGNGDVLVVSGENHTAHRSLLPQVWQTAAGSYRNLTAAEKWLPLYPWMYLAPNGRVFNAGPNGWTSYLNTSGTGTWDPPLARSNFGDRDIGEGTYGSSAMYADGKILIMGGSDPATATAEVIDLNAANPSWRYVAPMASPRKQHVATILPDGKVLVVGGHSGPGKDNPAYPVLAAELWDPDTERWTTLASMATYRGYHSTAFVLPDGRVVSAGGEDVGANAEIFSPPYLFRGPRPTITAAPASVAYGQQFSVTTPDAANIAKVTLLRLPSVTHGFDQNQRFAKLTFTPAAGALSVTAPSQPNLVPPGHYMMYLLDSSGVPSVAKIIRIGDAPAQPPPPPPPPTTTTTTTTLQSATTTVPPTTTTIHPIPPAPTGLTAASPRGSRRVDLRWTHDSGHETGFRIERSGNGTSFTQIAAVPADVVTYSNTDLAAGTRYWYRVRAYNTTGASPPSNTVSVRAR
jgi:galactose oxidase